ncbi:hypothetical protein LX32DRAFT_638568 [Colletotrichum zoysiae]|uniref:Uncharacterized protein n=1 Tax=Colletotrichum zoysiae TaxID=1216348 RepID=A0AAD9HKX2_9PEZI|nr:hypothetical protein LX32DRAFT_638568 [Colletotrichum zoysiae]
MKAALPSPPRIREASPPHCHPQHIGAGTKLQNPSQEWLRREGLTPSRLAHLARPGSFWASNPILRRLPRCAIVDVPSSFSGTCRDVGHRTAT